MAVTLIVHARVPKIISDDNENYAFFLRCFVFRQNRRFLTKLVLSGLYNVALLPSSVTLKKVKSAAFMCSTSQNATVSHSLYGRIFDV